MVFGRMDVVEGGGAEATNSRQRALIGEATSWIRLKRIFPFHRSQSRLIAKENESPVSAVEAQPGSLVHSFERSEVSTHSVGQCKVLVGSNVCPTKQSSKMQRSSILLAAQMRVPMIKFIGARLPRPHFDPASLPPIPTASVFATGTAPTMSSQPPVGKIPRGQSIEEWQLPLRLRRQPISAQECAAINNGGAYGLE